MDVDGLTLETFQLQSGSKECYKVNRKPTELPPASRKHHGNKAAAPSLHSPQLLPVLLMFLLSLNSFIYQSGATVYNGAPSPRHPANLKERSLRRLHRSAFV